MLIRKASAADKPLINALIDRAFAQVRDIYYPNENATVVSEINDPRIQQWVVEADGQIVATVSYELRNKRIELFGLATDPDHQRKGYAKALIERLGELARQAGLHTLVAKIVTETDNEQIYLRMGFRPVRTFRSKIFSSDILPTVHETVMEKLV